ncbi:MAG: sulfatase [Planctomycetales bacterium]|nr:sulfatase [Planctomycetales bacterium]
MFPSSATGPLRNPTSPRPSQLAGKAAWLLIGLAALQSGMLAQAAVAADRPNILFIFTDDHAPHAIGAYDGTLKAVNPTPNIDVLARQGMLFRNSFCTNSICGPSRAVIQTGKHSHLNGFMHNANRFDGNQQTFPKLLQKAGYRTAMIGKWHLKSDPQGFDHWQVLPGQGEYYNPDFLTPEGRQKTEGYCTDLVTDFAIDWLKAQSDSGQPFMLMCQHKAPHRTWMPALRHLHLYDDIEIPYPETLFDDAIDNARPARHQEMEIDRHMNLVYDLFVSPFPGWNPDEGKSLDRSGFKNLEKMTPEQRKAWDAAYEPKNQKMLAQKLTGKELVHWKYQRYIKNYLRCVKGVDESVGRLMDYLKESGLDKNTIVIYSSDQGFYLGDHGWYDKRWMYEESLKMPLIVKWPGVTRPGAVNEDLVQNLDYAETFLDAAGAEIPQDMQGRSLKPILAGNTPADWRKSIYYHYHEYPSVHMVAKHYGVRTQRYKLIRFYQFDEWEFYDLQSDPDELKNQYDNPEYAAEIAELKRELTRLREHYRDDTDVTVMPRDWQQKRLSGDRS